MNATQDDTERLAMVVQAPEVPTPSLKELARRTGASSIVSLLGGDNQAFRLEGVKSRDDAAVFCADEQLDLAFVPAGQHRDRVRLVSIDMDSTLIAIECIDEIADLQGLKPQVAAITAAAMRGEIDFAASLVQRVALLAGLDVDVLQRVYDERLVLSPGAERMLAGFCEVGAKTLLVSGGFTFFTDRLKERLGLDCAVSNTLEIVGGKLTGRIEGTIVDARVKAEWARRLAAQYTTGDGLTLAIGDGANDLPVLREADISVAYHAKPIVRAACTYAIDYCGLDAVLNLFD
ncbi:MAG: phosphoserine phosphatase SerB [Pseudomonadota bacterium]|nr:phosphoserine phosphatase SerB [Pseudomonadota bacterium]